MENGIVVIAVIVVLVVLWAILGGTLQQYGIIEHPAYWSLYGTILGLVLGTILGLVLGIIIKGN